MRKENIVANKTLHAIRPRYLHLETRAWHGELSAEEEEERLAALVKEFKHEQEHGRIIPAQSEIMAREAEIETRSAADIAERRRRHEGRLPREVAGNSKAFPFLKSRWGHESKKVGRARQDVIDRLVKLASDRCRLDLDAEVEAAHVTLQTPQVGTTDEMVHRSMRLPLDKLKQHRVRLKSERNHPHRLDDVQGMSISERNGAEQNHARFLEVHGEEHDTITRLTARHNVKIGIDAADAVRKLSTSPQKGGIGGSSSAAPRSPQRYMSPRRGSVGTPSGGGGGSGGGGSSSGVTTPLNAGRIDLIKQTTGELTRTLVAQMFERADAAFVGSPDKDVLRLSLRHGSGDSSTSASADETETGYEETETGFDETDGGEDGNDGSDDGGSDDERDANARGSGSATMERNAIGKSARQHARSSSRTSQRSPYQPTARGRSGTIVNLQGIQRELHGAGLGGSGVSAGPLPTAISTGQRGRSGTVANLQGIQSELQAMARGESVGGASSSSSSSSSLSAPSYDYAPAQEEERGQSISEIMAAMASLQRNMANIGAGDVDHPVRRASIQLLGGLSTHFESLGYASPLAATPELEQEQTQGQGQGRGRLQRSNTLSDVSTLQGMQNALRSLDTESSPPEQEIASPLRGEQQQASLSDISDDDEQVEEEEEEAVVAEVEIAEEDEGAVATKTASSPPIAVLASPRRGGEEGDVVSTVLDGNAAESPTKGGSEMIVEEHSMSFGFDELSSSVEEEEETDEEE